MCEYVWDLKSHPWVKNAKDWMQSQVLTKSQTYPPLQGELRLERTKLANLELQLEERRRTLETVEEALERKREKKKKWKAAQRECGL